jgi:predicted nucleic acid-binding protein
VLVAASETRRGHGDRLLDRLVPLTEVLWVDASLHGTAVGAFVAARSRTISLVDQVSFALMRREGITTAFAFDDDFRRAGVRTIP